MLPGVKPPTPMEREKVHARAFHRFVAAPVRHSSSAPRRSDAATSPTTPSPEVSRLNAPLPDPRELFGSTDIYLLDQVLRGRIAPGTRVLDAGCGRGRNLVWFLRAGHDVRAVDPDPAAIEAVRALAARLAPGRSGGDRFRVARVEDLDERDAADAVLCNAVLHFARDDAHFEAMLDGLWRAVAPGGLCFVRLASSIGLVGAEAIGEGRWRLPDGTDRYLVDEARLEALLQRLGAIQLDPLKTTLVARLRAMTTWVLGKPG